MQIFLEGKDISKKQPNLVNFQRIDIINSLKSFSTQYLQLLVMLELFVFLTIESNLAGIPKAHQGHSFTKKQHITYVI